MVEQRGVETAGRVIFRRRGELVVEAEAVEKGAQAGVVVGAEARMGAERVRHLGQRLVETGLEKRLVGHVVGHLAQPVHVVGEGQQARRNAIFGQDTEGMAHHGGAGDLAEGADMRQARGAVAGLEQNLALPRSLDARDDLAGFLERPGLGRGENRGIVNGRESGACHVVYQGGGAARRVKPCCARAAAP